MLNQPACSFCYLERRDNGVSDWQATLDTDDGAAKMRSVRKTVIIQMPLLPLNWRDYNESHRVIALGF